MTMSLVHGPAEPRSLRTAGALLRLPRLWLQRHAARKELATLDAAQMRDCGLDPLAVRREAIKPFWRG